MIGLVTLARFRASKTLMDLIAGHRAAEVTSHFRIAQRASSRNLYKGTAFVGSLPSRASRLVGTDKEVTVLSNYDIY